MKKKGISFFSGGKDGLYAIYLAQKRGIDVEYLLTLKTTIELSPHYENLSAIKKIAKSMRKEMLIFDMEKGEKSLIDFISRLDLDYLIGGDIFLTAHYEYLEKLADEIGINMVEPLWKIPSLELANKVIEDGFKYVIIAVNKEKLAKKNLGYKFETKEDLKNFVEYNPNTDPMGEYGEFHTVVISSPLFSNQFEFIPIQDGESKTYYYLKFEVRKNEK